LLPPLIFNGEHAGILVSTLAPILREVLARPPVKD
jgi:hypothetical protein